VIPSLTDSHTYVITLPTLVIRLFVA